MSDYSVSGGNVFADLGLPDAEEALARSDLAAAIWATIRERGLSEAEAARLLEIDQADVARIVRGHLDTYTIDRLLQLLTRLNRNVTIVIGEGQSEGPGSLRVRAG